MIPRLAVRSAVRKSDKCPWLCELVTYACFPMDSVRGSPDPGTETISFGSKKGELTMETGKYSVLCPVCEKKVLRASGANGVEVICPKCKRKLEISISLGTLVVQDMDMKYERIR